MSGLITSLSYDETENLVMVNLFGKASVTDIIDTYKKITCFAKVNSSNKLLVDVSELKRYYPRVEVINLFIQIKALLVGFKMARITGIESYRYDIVLQKAKRFNLDVENFDCTKKAKHWLNTLT
ncbi:hypothetical protein [Pseudoalteromonas denitrificans]|uniref:SpoIIAA-like n=1 Tax=Pseudoalteromonas denitrificans DSM 6059 TaxID=1123010 RepID=A0A1I1FDB2_9GAMM|nr:hypothetical protein [Pseudoalteromonas denitrificans]SFB97264.1 hypothetical protein SAMN02745724_00590 [Pseudoalteromonas denitrificans DSM 6059]